MAHLVGIPWVYPPPPQLPSAKTYLVDVNAEDEVIPEHRQPVQRGHLDDKGKEVVNDGVEELVRHLPPAQV